MGTCRARSRTVSDLPFAKEDSSSSQQRERRAVPASRRVAIAIERKLGRKLFGNAVALDELDTRLQAGQAFGEQARIGPNTSVLQFLR